jgi:hypothetical protein
MGKQRNRTTTSGPEQEFLPAAGPVKSVEIEYSETANGWTVYKTVDGEREHPPLIWHESELDDCLKRVAREQKQRIVITIEMRDS